MKALKWLILLLMAALMIVLGGFREIMFVNINEQIQFNNGLVQDYRVLESFNYLSNYSTSTLTKLKWLLTIAFSLAFLLLGYITLAKLLNDSEGGKWLLITYAGALALAGAFLLLGGLTGQNDLGYTISRVFMGALQSPFILMLMIPARMLAKRM